MFFFFDLTITFFLSRIVLLRYGFFLLALFFVAKITGFSFFCFFCFFCFGTWSFIPFFFLPLGSMVDSSEVSRLYPFVSFFFARLGASLGSSHSFGPLIEIFLFGGSGLGLVLADLLPLLR